MARPADTNDVGALIVDFLRDADAGRARDTAGGAYTAAALRSLRRSLDRVDAAIGRLDSTLLMSAGEADLERLGREVVDVAGLPPGRLDAIVHALGRLSAYACGRRSAESASWVDRATWPEPPRRADLPPRMASPASDPAAALEARTPTFTMLALGARVSAWIERTVVIAFVLTAIGLAIELL
jgi:hypothetical protein